ncbi:hypothetical protein [Phascolarctobacterium sp.]|uniref:hypothetical protein n=1 Tax=Phascolarctobacterium sp. TaxID=2049039 RepID=UPI0038642730
MTWTKHIGITLGVAVVVFLVCFLGVSNVVIDAVEPIEGLPAEWVAQYQVAALFAVAGGVACSFLWYKTGKNYDGRGSIVTKYYLIWLVSLFFGVASIFLLDSAYGGAFFAQLSLPVASGFIYWVASYFASADSVKNIPLFR